MDRIAYIFGETFIYWSSIILTMAAVSAVCLFLFFYLNKEKNVVAAATVIPLSVVFSLVFARFMHWYCRADSYFSFVSAMTDYSSGGYALLGVFAGCALAAVIVRVTKITENLPSLLDSMSLAGCAGIAVGRLSCFFNTQDRGQIIASTQSLPWVYPVTNSVSGVQEYRLATFVIQAMVTAVVFAALFVFAVRTREKRRDGDLTLFFLLLYGATQVVLDSTRYDSLFFRSNGFISIVQVVSALATGLACVIFSVRLVRRHGFQKWYVGLWVLFAAFVGLGCYMEYHVQRHGDQPVFAYSFMSLALTGMVAVVIAIWLLVERNAPHMDAPSGREKTEKPGILRKKAKKAKKEKKAGISLVSRWGAESKPAFSDRKKEEKAEQPKTEETNPLPEEDVYIPLDALGLPEDFFWED